MRRPIMRNAEQNETDTLQTESLRLEETRDGET